MRRSAGQWLSRRFARYAAASLAPQPGHVGLQFGATLNIMMAVRFDVSGSPVWKLIA